MSLGVRAGVAIASTTLLTACAMRFDRVPPDVDRSWVVDAATFDDWLVALQPGDLAAGVGMFSPVVTISPRLPGSLAALIAPRVVEWPERTPVAGEFRELPAGENRELAFGPAAPLDEDRWYALEVPSPEGVSFLGGSPTGDGFRATRFRPGPASVLQHVRVSRDGDRIVLRVGLSQGIDDDRPLEDLVTVDPFADCRGLGGGSGFSFVELSCESPADVLYVGIAPGVETAIDRGVSSPYPSEAPRRLAVPVPDSDQTHWVWPTYTVEDG